MWLIHLVIYLLSIIVASVLSFPNKNIVPFGSRDVPPLAKHSGTLNNKESTDKIVDEINRWKPEDGNNVWELSGLYQGDIMSLDENGKNGLLDESMQWPDAIVPYHIEEDDFSEEDIEKIEKAVKAYHEKTCIRFRPYKKGDKNFITVKGDNTGCWSYVGKHGEGQVVNLQNPGCMRHGTIVHEFMHALGFYHQQSSADRDQWVTIAWDNIISGREHNFNKYDNDTVTDYGVKYDYSSVMHYSALAFSKNRKPTIIPKMENVTLGQRDGFSDKDIEKINIMYKKQCEIRTQKEKETMTEGSSVTDIISSLWPFML